MAELDIDQSNLPSVQEVCQCFAVLEDGALAHNLQEQEIEQYYSSNVQRNQLVQNDLRVAKMLQDEEQQRSYRRHRQADQQLEEQDSEYARRIQDDIQRCAEETRRRDDDDEEMAKQIQEEEELHDRQLNESHTAYGQENANAPPHPTQPAPPLISEEEESFHQPYLPSPSTSDYEEDHYESRRQVHEDSRDPGGWRPRPPPPRELPSRSFEHQDRRSSGSQVNRTGPSAGGWGDVVRLIKNDMSEHGYLSCTSDDELFEPVYRLEQVLKRCQQTPEQNGERVKGLRRHHSACQGHGRTWHGEPASRAESSRASEDGGGGRSNRSESRRASCCPRSLSFRDSRPGDAQRRVHFQDDSRCRNTCGVSRRESEGGHVTSLEREVWSHTVSSYPIWGEIGRNQACCAAGNGGPYWRQLQGLEQGCPAGRIYRDVDRRVSGRVPDRTCRHGEAQHFANAPLHEPGVMEEEEAPGRGRWGANSCRVRGELRRRVHSLREESVGEWREGRGYRDNHDGRHVWSEPWRGKEDESSSTEDEELARERRRRRRRRRRKEEEKQARVLPQRSLSLWCSGCSPRAGHGLQKARASLDLGELKQVLMDEELARRLQAEEEELIRRHPPSVSPSQIRYPEGDFEVAQVAQDEELAHYMQKQEMQANRESRDLDGGRWQEGSMTDVYDEGVDFERQRERLDSEGLRMPTEACSPEFHPPSPIAMATHQLQFRNVAEDLDPTFQRNEHVQTVQNMPGPCPLQTQPAFVPPTKRHSDKPGRVKASGKKETCKQQ